MKKLKKAFVILGILLIVILSNGRSSFGAIFVSIKNEIAGKYITISPIEVYNVIDAITNDNGVASTIPSLGNNTNILPNLPIITSPSVLDDLSDRQLAILANYNQIKNKPMFMQELRDIATEKKNQGVYSFVLFPVNTVLTQAGLKYYQKVMQSNSNNSSSGTSTGSGTTGESSSGTSTGSGTTGGSSNGTSTGSGTTGGSSNGTSTGSGTTGGSSGGTSTGTGTTGGSSSGTSTGTGTTGGSSSGTSTGSDSSGSSSSGSGSSDEKYTVSGVVIRPGESGVEGEDLTNPANNPDAYKPGEMGNNDTLIRLGGIIVGALKIIGIIAAVVILVVLGIKYLTGTIAEKAEYKKTMIPYVIGAFFLGAGGVIIELIFNLLTNITY